MVVSLYVCDIPQNIEKEELESVFSCFDGFVEVRLAKDKNRQKIAFVDYEAEEEAKNAMNSTRGFRFAASTRGITVRYSENTKNNTPQQQSTNNQAQTRKRDYKAAQHGQSGPQNPYQQQQPPNRNYQVSPNVKDPQHYPSYGMPPMEPQQQPPNYYGQKQGPPPQMPQQPHQSMGSMPRQPQQMQPQSMYSDNRSMQEPIPNMLPPYQGGNPELHSQLAMPGQQSELLSLLNNFASSAAPGYPQSQTPYDMSQQLGGAQILSSLFGQLTSQSAPIGQTGQMPYTSSSVNQPQSQQSQKLSDSLSRIQGLFGPNIMPIPKNAANTVYVEGIPLDASEREVAHIFRPFPGFKSVRLIHREKKPGEKVILCFADFENPFQTTLVINTLQGYRFDKDDILGLQFSYANKNNKYSSSKN